MRTKRLMCALLFALFAVAQAQPVTLDFWYSGGPSSTPPLTTLVERFNSEHPDINVEISDIGSYSDISTRLQAAVASGRVPDIVQLEITAYGIFADRGVILDLTPFIENTPDFSVDDLIPGIWEAAQYKGTPYVIPFNNSVPVMYYNRDLFSAAGLDPENPPETWGELLAAAQTLTAPSDAPGESQWGVSAPPQWVRNAFVRQNGGRWMNDDLSEMTLDQPEAQEAYQFLIDLINVHQVAYAEAGIDANENLAKQDFLSGRTAIMFGSIGDLNSFTGDAGFEVGVAALPCQKECAAPIGGATIGILSTIPEDRQAAAWQFITWLTSTENNAFWHTQTGYMPIRKSTLTTESAENFYTANPNYKVAIDEFECCSFPRPRPPAMPAIRQLERTTWEEIVTGRKTVERALEELSQEGTALLNN